MTVTKLLGSSVIHEGSRADRRSLLSLIVGLVIGFCFSKIFIFSKPPRPDWTPYARHDVEEKDIVEHQHLDENNTIAAKLYNEVRVLCWVMTNPNNHQKKARHVKRTWGKRCNKLLFMSTKTDPELDSIALPVKEGRKYLWAKTKAAFEYIYLHHMDDADWFYKADDDTYAIVENMRFLLYPYSPETPVYFGCRFKPFIKQGYMSGGAGYVLSKEAVRRFVKQALPNPKICHGRDDGPEDMAIGKCLQNVNVLPGDSRDEHLRGKFFPFQPESHLIPDISKKSWLRKYQYYEVAEGLDCCSDNAISFHHIDAHTMYELEYLIYHLRPYGIVNSPAPLPDKFKIGEIATRAPATEPKNQPIAPKKQMTTLKKQAK